MASKIGINLTAKLHAHLVYNGEPLKYKAFAMKFAVIKVCCTKMFLYLAY